MYTLPALDTHKVRPPSVISFEHHLSAILPAGKIPEGNLVLFSRCMGDMEPADVGCMPLLAGLRPLEVPILPK